VQWAVATSGEPVAATRFSWFRGEVVAHYSPPRHGCAQHNFCVRYAAWGEGPAQPLDYFHCFTAGGHHLSFDGSREQGARWVLLSRLGSP
jgi:hypothetical protein